MMDGASFHTRSLAERRCARYGIEFAEQFRYHYVLGADPNRSYPGWRSLPVGGRMLHAGAALPAAPIYDADSSLVGWLLGIAMHPEHGPLNTLTIPESARAAAFADVLEQHVSEMAGRYVVIVSTGRISRVYHDPVGDLPVIFDPETGLVGSALSVMLDRSVRLVPDMAARAVLKGRRHIGFGRTLDAAARYCLPNHYLDLDTMQTVRYWPTDDTDFDVTRAESEAVTTQIIDRLRGNITALTRNFDTIMPLTGGRDSRMLLACTMPDVSDIRSFVCHRFNGVSRRDAQAGKAMADRFDLPFQQFFKKERASADLRDLRLRMGWSGHRAESRAITSMNDYPADHLVLRGQIMELLRATQWQDEVWRKPIEPEYLVQRAGILGRDAAPEARATALAEMQAWLDGLPERARPRAPDLAWMEFKLSHYQGSYFMGFHRNFFINPFNDRYLIRRGAAMRPAKRKDDTVVTEIIAQAAPDLLDFPFN